LGDTGSLSSAILKVTKDGWTNNSTRRSETAKQNSKVKDGECSSRVFQINNMMVPFPKTAESAKMELKTQDITLTVVNSPVCCQ